MADQVHPDVVAALENARRLTEQYAEAQDRWGALRATVDVAGSRGRIVVDGYGRVVDLVLAPGELTRSEPRELAREVSQAGREAVARSAAARSEILAPLGITPLGIKEA